MTLGEPDYIIDPLFYTFLDSAVYWAEELQIHLIIDNHTFDPAVDTKPDIEDVLLKVWPQVANHYKNTSQYIYYEVLNEPHGIADNIWNNIQQNVIDAIREIDTTHFIVVGPANWNGYNNLKNLPEYTDDKLIYTFHFYDPFLFTHQGATWNTPSMGPLKDVPFPYHADSMPDFPSELDNTWVENSFNNYANDGTEAKVKELIDIAVQFKNSRNVPMLCGEFGVFIPNSPRSGRLDWYELVSDYLEEKGIAWTIWDYTGSFGIFETGGNDIFEYDIDTALVSKLGLTVPEQQEFVKQPDTVGIIIYNDFIGEKISESSNAANGIIDLYNQLGPNNGLRCIKWSEGNQYASIGFDFKPNKDLTNLRGENYALDMMVRGNTSGSKLDIRFLDTKTTAAEDHPWRVRYTIDNNLVTWDRSWQHIHIPLTSFTEQGSWDNDTWFNPIGAFDWTEIDRFEIVAEHHNLSGRIFYFDNIHITNQDTAIVYDTSKYSNSNAYTTSNDVLVYPNPAIDNITFSYKNVAQEDVELKIFDISGRELYSGIYKNWTSTILWDCKTNQREKIQSGVYFYRLAVGNSINKGKVLISDR
ncbi:MAG: cellulase family glycosylhydrolase [Bacteroidales bacterium]|nr:cellulase family glycosylhydrolase [Bacteroidales bacterium]